jgi:hypothetical protein
MLPGRGHDTVASALAVKRVAVQLVALLNWYAPLADAAERLTSADADTAKTEARHRAV